MSTRVITTAMQTAIAQSQYTIFLFVELQFGSGTVRFCTAGHDLSWNGFNWLGVGKIGAVESINEDASLQANVYRLSLSGLDADIIEIAMQEDYHGRPARIWMPLVDLATGAIIADPLLLVKAKMDSMELTHGATASVALNIESELAAWDRPKVRRYTDADQKAEYPNDRGFEFVAQSATRTFTWGRG
jgi:hypothetical protein